MDFLFPTSRTGLLFTLCGAPSQAEKCGAHGKMYVIFKGPLLTNQWLAAILRHDNPLNLSYHFGSFFFSKIQWFQQHFPQEQHFCGFAIANSCCFESGLMVLSIPNTYFQRSTIGQSHPKSGNFCCTKKTEWETKGHIQLWISKLTIYVNGVDFFQFITIVLEKNENHSISSHKNFVGDSLRGGLFDIKMIISIGRPSGS